MATFTSTKFLNSLKSFQMFSVKDNSVKVHWLNRSSLIWVNQLYLAMKTKRYLGLPGKKTCDQRILNF